MFIIYDGEYVICAIPLSLIFSRTNILDILSSSIVSILVFMREWRNLEFLRYK